MKSKIKLKDLSFEVMIPSQQIDAAVDVVAAAINRDYAQVETPIFLGVLNGSFMFMSDLMKKVEFNSELSFVKLASYESVSTSGAVKNLIGLNSPIEGRHVIVVEDIVDSGNSIEHLVQLLAAYKPASVKICTLFFKPKAYTKQISIDYKAMEIGNEFIVGYGLDYDQLGRNLKDIYVVCNE
ncbi:MAG: hypoxanthine phosphoribosyltransferase [Rikenellaceae bacterium]